MSKTCAFELMPSRIRRWPKPLCIPRSHGRVDIRVHDLNRHGARAVRKTATARGSRPNAIYNGGMSPRGTHRGSPVPEGRESLNDDGFRGHIHPGTAPNAVRLPAIAGGPFEFPTPDRSGPDPRRQPCGWQFDGPDRQQRSMVGPPSVLSFSRSCCSATPLTAFGRPILIGQRQLWVYSVEKLCFEDTTCASDPLERSQFLAHGGVLPTRRLSPTSRY